MKNIYGVYGKGGFAREVAPLVLENLVGSQRLQGNELKVVRVVDEEFVGEAKPLSGFDVFSYKEFIAHNCGEKFMSIAIADPQIRKRLTDKCTQDNIKIFTVMADNAVVLHDVSLGAGAVICPFVTLTTNITIGKGFQANLYSYVGHDCVIEDYVTFAPGVKCNGNVVVKEFAFIGAGAIIKDGKINNPIVIGRGAVVGAGSFVTKNVPDGVTVFGNPARVLSKENLRRR